MLQDDRCGGDGEGERLSPVCCVQPCLIVVLVFRLCHGGSQKVGMRVTGEGFRRSKERCLKSCLFAGRVLAGDEREIDARYLSPVE